MRNGPRAARPLSTLLILVFMAGAGSTTSCCSDNVTYPDGLVSIALQEIVATTTSNVLRTPLMQDPELSNRLATLHDAREGITTLDALAARWASLPPPAGVQDLEENVFAEARADGSWDDEARKVGFEPESVPDAIYLAGFWTGVAKAIGS